MAVSQDDPKIHDLEEYELREQLVGIKGKNKTPHQKPTFHWGAFQIPVLVFIFAKTVLYYTPFTADTKTIIDIVAVIGIVAGLNIYFHYVNKEKYHG